MTPDELKRSIFIYAMQGKLVEQREAEGTADDFYNDIIKVCTTNKNLLPIQDEDIPFEIPSSWRWCRFGEIASCSIGRTPPRAELIWWGEDIPWVSISDMVDYGIISDTKEKVSLKAYKEKFGEISKVGTLLMSFKLTVGRTSILDIDALHNEAIISIYPYVDSNNYFRNYLFYLLPIITQWGESKNAIKGKTLNSKSIANLMIPLPPLAEQHRIVAKIEELLPYVDRYAEAYERLEEFNAKFPDDMKKSILQYAIEGRLVEQRAEEGTAEELYRQIQSEKAKLIKEGKIKKEKPLPEISEDEIPFDIPESWKWVRLGECVTILGDGIHGTPKYTVNGEYHFINGNNLSDGIVEIKSDTKTVSFEEYELYKKELNDHTVFVSINGTIGNVAFYNGEKIILGKSACYFNLIQKEWKEYIFWLIKTDYFLKYALTKATGTTIKNVSLATMKSLPIPLPPLAEQRRIVAMIEELLPLCERLAECREKA